MLTASNRGAGMNIGFPDVCLTPPVPVPVPYPNFALNCLAVNFSTIVFVCGLPALNIGSIITTTFGDDPGVAHWTVKGPGTFVTGNPIVFVEQLPGVNLTCPTTGNTMNNPVGAQLVPSAANVFYTYAEGEEELAEALDRAPPPSSSMPADGVGLLAIRAFTADVATRAFSEIRRLVASGLRALILDLRDNPGGELRAFVELASDFLPAGAELGVFLDGDGDEVAYKAAPGMDYKMPVAVLVSRRTASAAELFAGALKAHGRAVIVGESTFGKATALGWTRAAGAAGMNYAPAALWELPGGGSIHGGGLAPDIAIAPGEDALPIAIAALLDRLSR